MMSTKLGTDLNTYYFVGTVIIYSEETEPNAGKIIVFPWSDSKLTQVTEKEVKGSSFSMLEFNRKQPASTA